MKLTLDCPNAYYEPDTMRIRCKAINGGYCGNQYFKRCKGWWTLSERAAACPMRKKGEANDQRQ